MVSYEFLLTQLQGDTTAFKRDFTDDIRVCDELELILANFGKEMKIFGIAPDVSMSLLYDLLNEGYSRTISAGTECAWAHNSSAGILPISFVRRTTRLKISTTGEQTKTTPMHLIQRLSTARS